MEQILSDPFWLTRGTSELYALESIYVDEWLTTSASQQHQRVNVQDQGSRRKSSNLLGLSITCNQTKGVLTIPAKKSTQHDIKRFNLQYCNAVDTPFVEKSNGNADNRKANEEEQKTFQETTVCLIYFATNSRYNIAYGVMVPTLRWTQLFKKNSNQRNGSWGISKGNHQWESDSREESSNSILTWMTASEIQLLTTDQHQDT